MLVTSFSILIFDEFILLLLIKKKKDLFLITSPSYYQTEFPQPIQLVLSDVVIQTVEQREFASTYACFYLCPCLFQVMALIAYLMEFKGNYGPHLIIVPNAVLVNWKVSFLCLFICLNFTS